MWHWPCPDVGKMVVSKIDVASGLTDLRDRLIFIRETITSVTANLSDAIRDEGLTLCGL